MARISGNMSRPVPFRTRRFRSLVLQSPSFDLFVYGDELDAMAELINQLTASGILTTFFASGSGDSGQEIGARLVTIGVPAAADTTSVHAAIADTTGRATLALSALTSAHMTTVVEADVAGPAGNAVTLQGVGDNLAAAKASLALATKTTHWNTVVQDPTAGAAGNAVTVAAVADAGAKAGSVTDVAGVVTFHFKDATSTVADMEALMPVTDLAVKTAGTGANVLHAGVDEFTATHLAGGVTDQGATITEVGPAVTLHYVPSETTVATAETALNLSTQLKVKTPGTGGTVLLSGDAFAATPLTGGGSTVIGTGFTNPDLPRSISVAFGASWDGGNLTVAGLDQFGAPVSEVITANPGNTVNGSQVFATVTSATLASSGSGVGTATIGVGLKLGVPFKLTNTSAIVYVDGVNEVASAVSVTFNSITTTTAPNGSHNFQAQVNVSA